MIEKTSEWAALAGRRLAECNALRARAESAEALIAAALGALPVGNIRTHTPDSIPDRITDLAKALAEATMEAEAAEALIAERDAEVARMTADLDRVFSALDNGADDSPWKPGESFADAIRSLRAHVAELENEASERVTAYVGMKLKLSEAESRNTRMVRALDRIANCEQGDATDRQAVMMMREIARMSIANAEDNA